MGSDLSPRVDHHRLHNNCAANVDVAGDRVELISSCRVRMKFCGYEVDVNRGRLALTRVPLVYCLEEVDNGPDLDAVALAPDGSFEAAEQPGMPAGVLALVGPGVREQAQTDSLYADEPPAKQEIKVTAVPYYISNNRGPGEMLRLRVRRASSRFPRRKSVPLVSFRTLVDHRCRGCRHGRSAFGPFFGLSSEA